MTQEKRASGVTLTDAERAKAQATFLAAYPKRGNITDACKAARISRQTFYVWTEHDETFGMLYQQAREAYNDALRAEIHRRAVVGVMEPVYQSGRLAGHVRKFSDTLLIFQSKARMPEYREKQTFEHTGPDGAPLRVKDEFDYAAFATAFADLHNGPGPLGPAGGGEPVDTAHPDH